MHGTQEDLYGQYFRSFWENITAQNGSCNIHTACLGRNLTWCTTVSLDVINLKVIVHNEGKITFFMLFISSY